MGTSRRGSAAADSAGQGVDRRPSVDVLRALVRTADDRVASVLRGTLALVIFPHGAQKLLAWFGGTGYNDAMAHLTGQYGLPGLVAFLVIVIEFFGPLALALGLLSRIAAAGIGMVMIGAALTTHLPHGFFMNWFGDQAGEGFEYHLLAVGLAIAVIAHGSGALSVDRALMRELSARSVAR